MREVIPGRIWIGNARDVGDVTGVLLLDIAAIVELAMEEAPVAYPRDIIHCRFPLMDGSGNQPTLLRLAIQTIATLIEIDTPTLVACSGGMSRSPAVVAAAMSLAKGDSPEDWLRRITTLGPHDVAPALWNDIRHASNAQ